MLTDEEIAQINRVRLPIRYDFRIDGRSLELSCIGNPSSIEDVTVVPHRSRGPNHRRFAATTAAGDVYGVDCVSNAFEYADINAVGVVRARAPFVSDGLLEFEDGRFKDVSHSLEDALRLRETARTSWRTGINYVTELEEAGGLPGRLGLRRPQVGALHAIAAHWSLNKEPAIVVMPTGTGKTEVMVAVTVESKGDRILVVGGAPLPQPFEPSAQPQGRTWRDRPSVVDTDRTADHHFSGGIDVLLHLANANGFDHRHQVPGGQTFDQSLRILATVRKPREKRPRRLVRWHGVGLFKEYFADALVVHGVSGVGLSKARSARWTAGDRCC